MPATHPALTVLALPAFQDNYLWLIHDGVHAAVVDPGAAAPVLAALGQHGLVLTAILLTHHHADHIGGVPELLAVAQVPVFGPAGENIAAVTQPLTEGARFRVPGIKLDVTVLDVPGHTRGHIAYVTEGQEENWLFCGDTLFAGGCGRLFEGTPAQMMASLAKLAALPGATKVYCAHEYTMANLRFAAAVEPDNQALQLRLVSEAGKRADNVPTIPSTIELEQATNPFLRATSAGIVASLVATGRVQPDAGPVELFTALRAWKNVF
ncbi:hydroxyacylglutathione hydrolase [Massilia sp. S19_KUP03_FR1]|uniref:hydroxyacylglutathione hydrolase n=1 Tax=Massilia sp. S19_KUP03_FR1 TaxID=3025503 RepID=UPI002FCD75CE